MRGLIFGLHKATGSISHGEKGAGYTLETPQAFEYLARAVLVLTPSNVLLLPESASDGLMLRS